MEIIFLFVGIVIGLLLDRNKIEEKKKIAQEKVDVLVKKLPVSNKLYKIQFKKDANL